MTNISSSIFNLEKSDYSKPLLFMGQQSGLFDTINKHYPTIWDNYKTMKSLDWDPNEFDYTSCNQDFKQCPRSVSEMMIKTLAWQWEADSVASKSVAPVLAPFITSSELWAAWLEISKNEVVHAATYSEIVRSSFDDPNLILDEILRVEQAHHRLTTITKVFADAYEASHKYAIGEIPNNQETYNKVFMMVVALLALERIQFMSSFAITFAITDTGWFQPIGKAVQKIAQEELEVHAELDMEVLRIEMKTERGQIAYQQCKPMIENLLQELVEGELEWNKYIFSEGRELPGLHSDRLDQWTLYNAKPVYNFLNIKTDKFKFPRDNPLKFMEKWLNMNKTQASPQEQDIAAYKIGIMRRNDDGKIFDVDF